jgi:hypothetical protein
LFLPFLEFHLKLPLLGGELLFEVPDLDQVTSLDGLRDFGFQSDLPLA